MSYLPADKYNVAWFKLAEFVVRGERERALGLYRLLVHSFNDQAFAYQLEGDILLSFNDSNAACEKYIAAAQLYRKNGKLPEAAGLYEHVITLQPKAEDILLILIDLYQGEKNYVRLAAIMSMLCGLFFEKNNMTPLTLLLITLIICL